MLTQEKLHKWTRKVKIFRVARGHAFHANFGQGQNSRECRRNATEKKLKKKEKRQEESTKVARVNQFYKGTNSSKIKYQDVVAEVKQYMKRRQLPYVTQRRILSYYEYCFQQQYFSEAEILNNLSSLMREEIGMHGCRKLVENVTFFNNLPLALITRIDDLLKSEIFLPNDIIVRVNEPGNCMYFIASGTVAIYTITGKEVCHLEDGAHFGEIALVMLNERRVASVVAVEICELYRLDRADFARTVHPYPMLWEQVKKIALERQERTPNDDVYKLVSTTVGNDVRPPCSATKSFPAGGRAPATYHPVTLH
ncbi:HCN4 protein, partial [Pseudoatta argentina]